MKKILIVAGAVLLCFGPLACNHPYTLPASPNLLITPTAVAQPPTATPGTCGASNVTPAQADNLLAGNLYGWYQPYRLPASRLSAWAGVTLEAPQVPGVAVGGCATAVGVIRRLGEAGRV